MTWFSKLHEDGDASSGKVSREKNIERKSTLSEKYNITLEIFENGSIKKNVRCDLYFQNCSGALNRSSEKVNR